MTASTLHDTLKRLAQHVSIARLKKDFQEISQFGWSSSGLTRLAYTEEHKRAVEFVIGKMKDAGFRVSVDPMYNVFAKRDGTDHSQRRVVLSASHVDSVKDGGRFDGTLGVLSALEALRAIDEASIPTRKPIEVGIFASEETNRFTQGTIGSRAIIGQWTRDDLDTIVDADGVSLAKALRDFGGNPDRVGECLSKAKQIDSSVELHVEQGPVLESMGKPVGIVTKIVSVSRFFVRIKGEAIHSGGSTVEMRRDALAAASEAVLAVEKVAKDHPEIRCTVGSMAVYPGSLNTVPGEAKFGVDLRCLSNRRLYMAMLTSQLRQICSRRTAKLQIIPVFTHGEAQMIPGVVRTIERCSQVLGVQAPKLASYGGHDTNNIAKIADVGMIFVRSVAGISHNRRELSRFKDIHLGTRLLAATLLSLAGPYAEA